MSELVEKVARELALEELSPHGRESFNWPDDCGPIALRTLRAQARAAIAVVLEDMRVPNNAMVDAALHAIDGNPRGSTGYATRAARKCWDAMLHAFTRIALDADTGV